MLELFRKLPIDQILRSSHQARKDFEHEGLIRLSESLRQEGLQNPVTVRLILCSDVNCQSPRLDPMEGFPPCPEGSHWHGELIAGERRLRAAGILGWQLIDAKVIQTVSEAEAAAKGLIENLQRTNLNPMEEAEGIQAMLDLKDSHWTQEQIGKVVGKSQSHISETLRLLDLPEQIKENIRRRIITVDHAAKLLPLPTSDLQLKVTDMIIKKGLTAKEAGAVANKFLKGVKAQTKKMGRPSSDFMSPVWPLLEINTNIKAFGYWSATLKKKEWVITVSREAISSQEEFADWFIQVGTVMKSAAAVVPAVPLSDEEEQQKAAKEDAEKLGKTGIGGFNK